MKKRSLCKLAGSSAILAVAAIGCTPSANFHPSLASKAPAKAASGAAKAAEAAMVRLAANDSAGAIPKAERAVELAPGDTGYRALLAQAYLGAGRFASASAAFKDVLTLDPNNGKAMLGLGLARTALGQRMAALSALSGAEGLVNPTDLGLALALAGDPQRAVVLLEPAARAADATAKTRQNLALAYALSGRWDKAKGIASVDVPADQIAGRMEQWAMLAEPSHASEQVASLLGVRAVKDPGLPQRLALANVWEPQGEAAVTVPLDAPEKPEAPAVRTADAAPVAAPSPSAPVPAVEAQPAQTRTAAAESVPQRAIPFATPTDTRPQPLVRAQARPVRLAEADAGEAAPFVARPFVRQHSGGRYVVQLGAYSQPTRVEAAWDSFSTQVAKLAGYTPSQSTYRLASGTLHRLSIAGIVRREDAVKLCATVRSAGGACFVRETAGDAPVQWVRRKTSEQLASAS